MNKLLILGLLTSCWLLNAKDRPSLRRALSVPNIRLSCIMQHNRSFGVEITHEQNNQYRFNFGNGIGISQTITSNQDVYSACEAINAEVFDEERDLNVIIGFDLLTVEPVTEGATIYYSHHRGN